MSLDSLKHYRIPTLPRAKDADPMPAPVQLATPSTSGATASANQPALAAKSPPIPGTTTAAPNPLKRAAPADVPAVPAAAAAVAVVDDKLPAQLTALFLPLQCLLCKINSNSPISAKTHYDSKQHDKKIIQWLLEWSQQMGAPVPKRAAYFEGPTGPMAHYCSTCDLALTSSIHAKQHYVGKRHNSVLRGLAKPSGTGHYDANGQWIRVGGKNTSNNTNNQANGGGVAAPDAAGSLVSSSSGGLAALPQTSTDVFCGVCNVAVSARSEMAKHLAGTKHAKKLRAAGQAPSSLPATAGAATPLPVAVAIDEVVILRPVGELLPLGDVSANRTPSGQFYCQTCNITTPNENSFVQHKISKKHGRMLRQSK